MKVVTLEINGTVLYSGPLIRLSTWDQSGERHYDIAVNIQGVAGDEEKQPKSLDEFGRILRLEYFKSDTRAFFRGLAWAGAKGAAAAALTIIVLKLLGAL